MKCLYGGYCINCTGESENWWTRYATHIRAQFQVIGSMLNVRTHVQRRAHEWYSGSLLLAATVGESRRCYHGVPRVLLSRRSAALAAQGGTAAGSPAEAHRLLEHISAARLNISVRQVAPRVSEAAHAIPDACFGISYEI